jgi:RHS repeat-associated protein
MMPAAKHGDPQMGVDIHLCVVPPSPSPVPLPTPHMSVVFDPFDYLPIFGGTVTVCGMKRATAGTNGIAVHIPPGFPFAPKLPDKDDELFMGSATVVADGDPFSHIGHPVLACQVVGMMSPVRPKKKGGPMAMVLPTVFNLAIPTNVFIGGPPTISMMGMAFKAAFKILGKFAKSGLFKRIRQKLFGFLPPGFLKCKFLRAEPVNILTGEVSVQQEDFILPGRIPIEWSRAYTSGSDHEGLCGRGWETPADTRLEIDPLNGLVSMRHPTIGPLFFARLPLAEGDQAGELEMVDGARLTDHGHEYQVRTKEDRIYHFRKAHARVNQRGTLQYPIGRIADLCGNWLDFERRGGNLTGINESVGRRIDVAIEDGRLSEMALQVPGTEVYHRFVRYEYDGAGDLVAVIDALGHPYHFAYDEHHLVRHTDRNGLSFYYEYDKAGEDWRVVHSWGDGGLYNYRFEYIDLLNERRITDSLGNVSVVKLDERGLPICEIDALGGRTIYEYDEAGRTTAIIDQDGHRAEFVYDERGNLLTLTRPDGTCVGTEFDATDKVLAVTAPSGAQWRQKWDGRGLLLEQTTPLGHRSRYEYDPLGQLVAFTSPRGSRTELSFDASGNLALVKDATGRATRFRFDALGNVTAKLDALGRETNYRYDVKSRLIGVRLPSGASIECGYDAESNLTHYVDENGTETTLEYCGLGEVARRIQPDGHSVEYVYDTEERLIAVRNQRGETYRLLRDKLGRIVEEVDYWGQPRRYEYSAAGNIRTSSDPLGRVVAYVTDPSGRILKKALHAPDSDRSFFEDTFEYDVNGCLVACANAHIRVERILDLEGHISVEKQGEYFTVRNRYDEAGNRIERRTDLTCGDTDVSHHVQYTYDALDQVSSIVVDDQAPIRIERDAIGQIIDEQLAAGLHREIEYGADGFLSRQRVRAGSRTVVDCVYRYDAVGNLRERRDIDLGVETYAYDPMGRIIQHVDPHGSVQRYFSDAAGDRLETRIVERVLRSAANASSNATEWSREGEYGGTFYHFDRVGNLIERRDERDELWFYWDANGRLTGSRVNGSLTRYEYDPFGRRIAKRTDDGYTRFVWDENVLVADASSEGPTAPTARIREWVYFPDTFEPVVMLSGDGSTFYYHNDPNGCPSRLTNAAGEVKWAATYSAWGDVTSLPVNEVEQPIRLQGQYEDAETGLYYNRCRYYDPRIGQFTSQDPLGLSAKENLYRIAPNIWRWIDPLGLNCELKKAVQARARELSDKTSPHYLSNRARGPVLAGVYDPVTKRTFFGINPTPMPTRWSDVIADRIKKVTPTAESLAKHGEPGSHAEIKALNEAILAREAATGRKVTEADLASFDLHNTNLRGANPGTTVPPPCPEHCAPIVDGVTWVP